MMPPKDLSKSVTVTKPLTTKKKEKRPLINLVSALLKDLGTKSGAPPHVPASPQLKVCDVPRLLTT